MVWRNSNILGLSLCQSIRLSWASLNRLQNVLQLANGPLKRLVYKSLIQPVLTYNCEQWCLTRKETKYLDVQQRHIMRFILKIRYPARIKISISTNSSRRSQCPRSSQELLTMAHIKRRNDDSPIQTAMSSSSR